jgi:hypothetical protein
MHYNNNKKITFDCGYGCEGNVQVNKIDQCSICGEIKMGFSFGCNDEYGFDICFECLDNIKKLSGQ